jgi:hypothetical protein
MRPFADERRRTGHGVEDALHAGADTLPGRPAARRDTRLGRPCESEEMRVLGLIELQCAGQRLQHAG